MPLCEYSANLPSKKTLDLFTRPSLLVILCYYETFANPSFMCVCEDLAKYIFLVTS